MARTAACVDIYANNNGTLADAFQFGTSGDTSWDFVSKTFTMDVKASRDDDDPLLSLTSGASEIIVDNLVTRVLHLNVAPVDLRAALAPGQYVYDLIMTDGITGVITPLMQGTLYIRQGVSEI